MIRRSPALLMAVLVCIPTAAQDKQPNQKPAASNQKPTSQRPANPRRGRPRPEDVQPAWIWLEQDGQPATTVYLRREIEVGGAVSARLYAAGPMVVYLDGRQVLEHDRHAPVFQDVTPQLDRDVEGGKQVLTVRATREGDGAAGVLLRVDLDSGWRTEWSVVSDASWQATSAHPADGWQRAGFRARGWRRPKVVARLGSPPWEMVTATALAAVAPLKEPTATPAETLKLPEGFHAELLYSVPKDREGSWVNLCVDPRGRLIVSDQYGGLYRVTPPPVGTQSDIQLEKIDVSIGEAQGLLWAFDALYVVVNRGDTYDSGLYRVRDTDGDDQLDTLDVLRKLDGSREHGPHAVLQTPDGKGLFIVVGNRTKLTEIDASRVPQVWDEDLLLPRIYGRGFMKGTPAPGGHIYRIDPDAKRWELVASGFRNEFDAAVNADGELFTFDADMEWDMNTPWYRPTRVCHVVSGAEFGWRNGAGKWPVYYPDSVPPVVNIGPASPTGICFGYGARFPAKYQGALFLSDWTYGTMYAAHLEPRGASYTATFEEFISGTPLPLTDVVINPHDGAMYFTIGGRRVQSGLYRVTYRGDAVTAPADLKQTAGAEQRALRKELEALHLGEHPNAVQAAWPHLKHADRFIRYAARVAIEHRPVAEWRERALAETDPRASLAALLAMARQFPRQHRPEGPELDTPPPVWDGTREESAERAELRGRILKALGRLDWHTLSVPQRLELLRVHTVTFLRLGPPTEAQRQRLVARFDARYPARARELNSELSQLLVYLQAPAAAAKTMQLLAEAPTQEEQLDYAKTLRHLRVGWTMPLREDYFRWLAKAKGYRGGASFALFVEYIKQDAAKHLDEDQHVALKPILESGPPTEINPIAAQPRPEVKKWTMQELVPLVENGLSGRDFDHGRKMFAAANCFACHRFDNQGGAIGPDLTALSGRFSPRDILESIVEPSKTISDQYAAVNVVTIDGRVFTGRIVNFAGDSIRLNTNMLDPHAQVAIDRRQIEELVPSKISMMPTGLLNTLNEEELLDLMAYLLSRGDREHPAFLGGE